MGEYIEEWGLKELKKAKGIKMVNINIGSLNAHESEFKAVFSGKEIEIINVSESWLKEDSDPNIFKLDGYTIVRQDRKTKTSGGGLISFIDSKFEVDYESYKHLNSDDKSFEVMVYEIKIPGNKPLMVISCYKPLHISFDIANEKLNEVIKGINNNVELYLVGDLNVDYKIKHGARFHKLKLFENKNILKQYIKSTTRPKEKSATAIDLIYSNSSNINKVGTNSWKPADHFSTFVIRKPAKIIKTKETVLTRRATDFVEDRVRIAYENENWNDFFSTDDVNRKWEILISKIDKVINDQCRM